MEERQRLGEILIAAGVIDELQLANALVEQSRWGRRLGSTLIKMGLLEEGQLIRALAKQLGMPVASLAGKRISDEVIAIVPARVATKHGVIPLFTREEGAKSQLYLGMEDPSDLSVLDDLRFRTGREIRPVMVRPSELGEALDRYYHGGSSTVSQIDPFRGGETFGNESLRVIERDGAADSANAAVESEMNPPASRDAQIEFSDVGAPVQELPENLDRVLAEAERTRVVAKALAQLLIEKGILTHDELQGRIRQLWSD